MADSGPLAHSPTIAATVPRGDQARLEAGAKVGDYVVERFIGAGAMGEVYAGRHPVIGKRVAIKVLRHELAASAEAAERFTREARAVNQIEHENVVDVFALGRLDDGRLYLLMDLVEGRSLRAHVVDGALALDTALAILDKVADALDAAHRKGVVHRDLKPDNIVLSNATPPKVFVLDFGLAKLIAKANDGTPAGPGTLTGQGTWLGTPGYMAPEQWSADGAGPASDRYALGVIAFELLSGAQPFSASSVPGMMEQHFRAAVPSLSSRGATGVPTAIDDVLRRALAKDPDARYPTARELVDALRAASGTGVHPARAALAPATGSRKLWVPAAAGAGVLGVAVVVMVAGSHDNVAPHATPPAEPPTDTVMVGIESRPTNAEIRVGGQTRGKTPKPLSVKPGETLDIVVAKPGYLADKRSVTAAAGSVVTFTLGEVTRFNGVWRLRNGELRAFERNADQVDVYKLREVAGAKTFFKHYQFAPTDIGVAFAAEDEVVDPRAPDDPGCHVRVRVEYHYDPERDVLEQMRERVDIDIHHGRCVVRERRIEPTTLARVDTPSDTVRIEAPVGIPDDLRKSRTKPAPTKSKAKQGKPKTNLPFDPKAAELQKKLDAKQSLGSKTSPPKQPAPTKVAPTKGKFGGKQPQAPYTGSNGQADSLENQQNAAPQQAQILPQPQAPPPQVNAEGQAAQPAPQPAPQRKK